MEIQGISRIARNDAADQERCIFLNFGFVDLCRQTLNFDHYASHVAHHAVMV